MQDYLGPDLKEEGKLFSAGHSLVGAVDEAGRGPLSGGVHVGIVVVGHATQGIGSVADSKALSSRRREELVLPIKDWSVDWAVGVATAAEIDSYGMMRALRLSLRRAMSTLKCQPDALLIDGNYDFFSRPESTPVEPKLATLAEVRTLVAGDRLSLGVAAASILAKTSRDAEMKKLAQQYPGYGWERNMGYGTVEHREAISRLGITPQHRSSFKLL